MNETSANRIYNFSAGPAVLPVPVLEQAQRDLVCLPGCGASVMEISHRSSQFKQIQQAAKADISELLGLPDNYRVLFLQGGSRLQFSMIPMNLLRGSNTPADYLITGSWGVKAVSEAVKEGPVNIAWNDEPEYRGLPQTDQPRLSDNAPYVYITSNETIQGVQFPIDPQFSNAPLVCDSSSDFLSRPVDMQRYGLLYACAQKNAGPAGVTVVIIREDLLERGDEQLPGYLNYREHDKNDSMYNTPPTFAIYVMGLVARWLLDDVGGLAEMQKRNQEKARLLYDLIDDGDDFFRVHAQPDCRSLMNVVFRLPTEELEREFLAGAAERGLSGLAGHRSVGGIRASIYNAMPREGVESLRDFMREFAVARG